LSAIATGLAEGTPLTLSLKTFRLSATAVEAAVVARAIDATTSRQIFACSEVLEVRFIV
jgi:hypothetical protein